MKHLAFIINGTARKKERLKSRLSDAFTAYNVRFYETTFAGEATDLARKAIEYGTEHLVSVGGDGSLNEAVNGCMQCDKRLLEKVSVGVFPYGSGNDFARSLGVGRDIGQLKQLIEAESIRQVDVGRIEFEGLKKERSSRHFINITDVGIGGVVTERLSRSQRWLGAQFNYQKAILHSFATYKRVNVSLKSEEYSWDGEVLSLIMANGRYFANGLCIAPQASISDGKIQLVILGKVSVWDYLMKMGRIRKGEIFEEPEITYLKVSSCSIDAEQGSCPIDMDGEFIGYAPLKLSVVPGALRFLVPN